jgi:hypothetical protein
MYKYYHEISALSTELSHFENTGKNIFTGELPVIFPSRHRQYSDAELELSIEIDMYLIDL